MLEAMQQPDNAFVTLTYSDDRLPINASGLATLDPVDLRNFLKRLRVKLPHRVRFFAVGEYGETTFRPHYHLGLFNFYNCRRGETVKTVRGRCDWARCCSQCRMVGDTWGRGDIEVRNLDSSKCEYLARYVTKKMTAKEDARLLGRHPEFPRQSRRPGLGYPAVAQMARSIEYYVTASDLVDVPSAVKQGKGHLPLGRYMRNKLRIALGLPEGAPDEVLRQAWYEQVLPVLEMAKKDNENPSLRAAFAAVNAGYEASLRAKMDLKGKGKL